jgi:hypothetical protein
MASAVIVQVSSTLVLHIQSVPLLSAETHDHESRVKVEERSTCVVHKSTNSLWSEVYLNNRPKDWSQTLCTTVASRERPLYGTTRPKCFMLIAPKVDQ